MSSRTSNQGNSRRQPKKLTASRVLFHWRFPVIIVLILIVLCCVLVGMVVHKLSQPKEEAGPTDTDKYQAAVYDTLLAEESELPANLKHELVTLDAESAGVDHDENGRVLLCMWHRYPDAYKTGMDTPLSYGDVTAVSAKEFAAWYTENKSSMTAENTDLRLQQLFGLPPLSSDSSKNTHFTTFWVSPDVVFRPAYVTDVLTNTMDNKFGAEPDETYQAWFNKRATYYYTQINQAWTRMGYTYDWADGKDENDADHYGLTEFLVPSGSNISVVQTYTTEEYLQQLAASAPAADADSKDGDQAQDDGKDQSTDSNDSGAKDDKKAS